MAWQATAWQKAPGFTLTETLLAIGVLSIAALAAAPGLGEYLRDSRRTATLNLLAHAVHTTRSAAAALGVRATLCGTLDGRTCAGGGDWSNALLVVPNWPAGVAGTPAPVRVLRLEAARLKQTVRCNRDAIELDPLSPSATTATVTVCDDRGVRAARAVIVSRTGRPRFSDRDASGRLLACP